MPKQKEIRFQDRYGELVGRQNGMKFFIRRDPATPSCMLDHWVAVEDEREGRRLSTGGRQYFNLGDAKEFCRRIAAGEITLEELQTRYDAEDAAREQAAVRDAAKRAKAFKAILEAEGISYRRLRELEVLRGGLGELGHEILLAYERGEGWPECSD